MEWEPNKVWEVAPSLSVSSQHGGQSIRGLCKGRQHPSVPGPLSASLLASLPPGSQLGSEALGDVTAPVLLHS